MNIRKYMTQILEGEHPSDVADVLLAEGVMGDVMFLQKARSDLNEPDEPQKKKKKKRPLALAGG